MARFVEWGHWGIDLRERDGDAWGNPGRSVHYVPFPCGPAGPVDGTVGSPERRRYAAMVEDWVQRGVLPSGREGAG